MAERITNILGETLPLLAFSYSSKGFANIRDFIEPTLEQVSSAFLFSLYDYYYLLKDLELTKSNDNRIRIWDSGGYEVNDSDDLSSISSGVKGNYVWTPDLYVKVANQIPWNERDILVSYDSYDNRAKTPPSQQIETAFSLFDMIQGSYSRDVILHLDETVSIPNLAQQIAPYIDRIDILGFTEKEVALTWSRGINFLTSIRSELQRISPDKYVPIHLFGCFDPKSIIYFFLSGADIFDGLTWLRYYMQDDTTFYIREFEATLSDNEFKRLSFSKPLIVQNNINELLRLRNNLAYSLLNNDYEVYASFQNVIKGLSERTEI